MMCISIHMAEAAAYPAKLPTRVICLQCIFSKSLKMDLFRNGCGDFFVLLIL